MEKNDFGQLCLGNQIDQNIFQQTAFSNISRISAGNGYSLFQTSNEEIYSCGYNSNGECGLGNFQNFHVTPTLIPNLPSNIVQFFCGYSHSLFLDSEGNVFSFGYNKFGQLGLAHNTNQNILNQIPNIPSIQKISCVYNSSYLIDFEGNLWSFGNNAFGQLGLADKTPRNIPTKIQNFNDIQQLSYGCCGYSHFLAKDSQSKIITVGNNNKGQLGTERGTKEMDSQYYTIWAYQIVSQAKSARK